VAGRLIWECSDQPARNFRGAGQKSNRFIAQTRVCYADTDTDKGFLMLYLFIYGKVSLFEDLVGRKRCFIYNTYSIGRCF
jgi:hypothetical protein